MEAGNRGGRVQALYLRPMPAQMKGGQGLLDVLREPLHPSAVWPLLPDKNRTEVNCFWRVASMPWHLRKKANGPLSAPKAPRAPKVPTIKPIKPLKPLRPIKPLAPLGYEYYWRD